MGAPRFRRVEETLHQAVEQRQVPGTVAAVWNIHGPESPQFFVHGYRRLDPSLQPLRQDTVFDLASLTKPLVTATLAARLVERGILEWSTPVGAVLRDLPDAWRGIRVWHLLSHSAGLPAWRPFWQDLRREFGEALPEVPIERRQALVRRLVLSSPIEAAPGCRVLYSDLSFMLLGFVVEALMGRRLDRAWGELGFSAAFRPVLRSRNRRQPIDEEVAATEQSDWRGGVLQGEVHDENCWSMGGIAGHAGLFGTASQVVEIVNPLFRGRLFSPDVAEAAFSRITPSEGPARTLGGWDVPSGEGSSAGPQLSARKGVVGHLGFTGTSLWVDRSSGWAFLLLTQRVHLGREHPGIRSLRPAFHEAALSDLGIDRLSSFERP